MYATEQSGPLLADILSSKEKYIYVIINLSRM